MLKNVFFVRSEVIKFYTRFVSKFFFFSFCHLFIEMKCVDNLKTRFLTKANNNVSIFFLLLISQINRSIEALNFFSYSSFNFNLCKLINFTQSS